MRSCPTVRIAGRWQDPSLARRTHRTTLRSIVDLIGILRALRRRWAYIVGGVVLGFVVAGGVIWASTPTYTGTAQVFISTPTVNATATDLAQGSTFTRQQVNTYARLVTTPLVLEPVLDDLQLGISVGELAGRVSAAAPVNTSLVSVTARDTDRDTAAAITNAVADSLVTVIPQLEQASDGSPAPVRATVIEPAQPPARPASPNVPLLLALGMVVGLAGGVGAALLRDRTDTVIRDRRDIARISTAPVLGSIPVEPRRGHRAGSAGPRLGASTSEAFRHLRTALLALEPSRGAFVVTSSVPQEGKTMVAAHLAMAVATAGSRVLLVDANMRGPRRQDDEAAGLSELLSGRAALEDVVRPWPGIGNLDHLAAGTIPPNPSELLETRRMEQLLDEVRNLYDLVLVDAPPLLPFTDGAVLARLADGVIVVVGRDRVDQEDLLDACTTLDGVRATPLGFIINLAPSQRDYLPRGRRAPRSAMTWGDAAHRERGVGLEAASQTSSDGRDDTRRRPGADQASTGRP
jgi:tyrosine-protein kinase